MTCVASEQAEGVARFPVQRARAEDAALVHGLHGRLAVFVGGTRRATSAPGDAFDVKDFTGDETLQQVVRLEIAELIEDRPELVGCFDLANADRRGVGARLQQPWRRAHGS